MFSWALLMEEKKVKGSRLKDPRTEGIFGQCHQCKQLVIESVFKESSQLRGDNLAGKTKDLWKI